MTFDQERVFIQAEPPGQSPWSQEFAWTDIERIAFKAEGLFNSDGIYIFTATRPESYVVPVEAEGGTALWEEILRRGLFDPELAIQAASATEGMFVWPPRFQPMSNRAHNSPSASSTSPTPRTRPATNAWWRRANAPSRPPNNDHFHPPFIT